MEKIKERPGKRKQNRARAGRPLQDCFKSKREADNEWRQQDAFELLGFLQSSRRALQSEQVSSAAVITSVAARKAELPQCPSRQQIDDCVDQVAAIRQAQARAKHNLAIKLTTEALRQIRSLPKLGRAAFNSQTQELLNLRSLSLIAIGECGEAWRCISLMAKLWGRVDSQES